MSPEQIAALKTLVYADPTASALAASADDLGLSAWLNTPEPTYWVWRPAVTDRDIMADAAFDWTRVDNLSVGKARVWETLFKFGSIDPSLPNVRAGIDAAWGGTAADLAVRASVYSKCRRQATRAEKALATGAGTTASPSTMTLIGDLSYAQASQIRS